MPLQNGALATSSVTLGGSDDTTRIRLIYAHLTATSGPRPYAPMDQEWTFQARDPARQSQVDQITQAVPQARAGFAGMLAQVASAISGAPNRVVRLADARASIELITAIYASSRENGAAVACPIAPEHALYQGWLPQGDEQGD